MGKKWVKGVWEKWVNGGKSGKKWEKVGEKWMKKVEEKWGKVGKVGITGEKLGKVGKVE